MTAPSRAVGGAAAPCPIPPPGAALVGQAPELPRGPVLADRSPTDELVVSGVRRVDDSTAIATYAWSADPGRAAGRLEITARRGRISAIKVEAFS